MLLCPPARGLVGAGGILTAEGLMLGLVRSDTLWGEGQSAELHVHDPTSKSAKPRPASTAGTKTQWITNGGINASSRWTAPRWHMSSISLRSSALNPVTFSSSIGVQTPPRV